MDESFTYNVIQTTDSCKGCGLCIATCPTGALKRQKLKPKIITSLCNGCLECIEVCPANAIIYQSYAMLDCPNEERHGKGTARSHIGVLDVGI